MFLMVGFDFLWRGRVLPRRGVNSARGESKMLYEEYHVYD